MDKPLEQPSLFAPIAYVAADPGGIVNDYPFALLVTPADYGVHATSTAVFFETDGDQDFLVGHMARRNPHAAALEGGQPALAVFWGPHAYVSSRWYEEKPEVPTWNYVAAHVRGVLEPIDDLDGQLAVLRRTAEMLEKKGEPPWTLEQAPDGRVDFLLPLIRSFRIRIDKIEGVTKLSQNHPASDRVRVVENLLKEGDGAAADVARLMAALGI